MTTPIDHKAAKEIAEFILSGYDPGSEYDLAQAYLDLTAKVELMEAALSFYADHCVWGNSCAAIDPCDTYTCDLGVLRGGKRAREVLERVKGK